MGFPTVVLPKGSVLFHGTIEPIRGQLRGGAYEHILWFADHPGIAQLYIPRSGSSIITSTDSIQRPSQHEDVRQVQRRIGLHWDYDRVKWGRTGRAESWYDAPGWENMDSRARSEEVNRRLADLGYQGKGLGPDLRYEFHLADDELLPPSGLQEGTLCEATTLRNMVLWEKATGEGDLTSVQYHDVEGFERALEAGLDGVIIDDFAQSEEWGNLGHLSVGLFEPALEDLRFRCVPATYEEWPHRGTADAGTKAWPHDVRPYFHRLLRAENPSPVALKWRLLAR